MDGWIFTYWDYVVLEVIDTRKFWDVPNTDPDTGMTPSLSQEPAPYSVQEIAVRLHRKPKRVLSSLKRLKRTEKAIETPQGWFSKARFPQNYYSN
jgi:hypothetical protein